MLPVPSLALALAALGIALPHAQAGVLVVDAAGPGPYLDIQLAVDAAQDGDVVLVRAGTYGTFAIADRSITVTADLGASVVIQGAVRVRNLAPGRTAVLAGLQANGTGATAPQRHGLYLTANAGAVRVQDCTFHGADAALAWDLPGHAAAVVQDCADVALTACSLTGGSATGGDFSFARPESGAGLVAAGSTVTVSGGSLLGGSGFDLEQLAVSAGYDGGHGGPGLDADASTLVASGAVLRGGDGGNADWFAPLFGVGGDGGDGARSSASTVHLLASPTLAGQGGWGTMGSIYLHSTDGPPGQARSGTQFVDWAGAARLLLGSTPRREGAVETLTVQGPADDVVLLGLDPGTGYAFAPAASGAWLLGGSAAGRAARVLPLGAVPVSGLLGWSAAIPDLGPGVDARLTHVQAVCTDRAGSRFLTGARVLIHLDQAY